MTIALILWKISKKKLQKSPIFLDFFLDFLKNICVKILIFLLFRFFSLRQTYNTLKSGANLTKAKKKNLNKDNQNIVVYSFLVSKNMRERKRKRHV